MSDISTWSNAAANNTGSTPDFLPEGCAPSTVNNAFREMQAAVRRFYEDAQWQNLGNTPTRVDNDTITISGDVTATYTVGRRLKFVGATTGYGTITASSYGAPNTTIDVTMDSGNVPTSLVSVSVGIVTPTNGALPLSRFPDGTSSAPSISFATETGLGFYRASSNTLGIAMAGAKIGEWALGSTGAFQMSDGNALFPSHGFYNETGTGFYRPATGQIGISLSGTTFGLIATGSFTPTWGGFSVAPAGTISWSRIGPLVYLYTGINNTGTSNATSMAISNIPATIRPLTSANSQCSVILIDNGAEAFGTGSFSVSGATLTFSKGTAPPSASGFTNSGTKGLPPLCLVATYYMG